LRSRENAILFVCETAPYNLCRCKAASVGGIRVRNTG
jgi:hypothetical protein